jgi:hypothetical protein
MKNKVSPATANESGKDVNPAKNELMKKIDKDPKEEAA